MVTRKLSASRCDDRTQESLKPEAGCPIHVVNPDATVSHWSGTAEFANGYADSETEDLRAGKDSHGFPAIVRNEPMYGREGVIEFAVTRGKDAGVFGAKESVAGITQQLEVALGHAPAGMAIFDNAEALVFANDKFFDLLGLSKGNVRSGMGLRAIVEAGAGAQPVEALYKDFCLRREAGVQRELRRVSDTMERYISIREESLPGGGWVVVVEDISERRNSALVIEQMAHYDGLTGIPNRALFLENLMRAVAQADRGTPFALLSLELDNLNCINDTFGHPVGDELLKALARRLDQCIREGDTIARAGGDDFAIIQTGISGPNDVEALAIRVAELLREPFEICSQQVIAAVSIGIALGPQDGHDMDRILTNADLALNRAKAMRPAPYCFFDCSLDVEMASRRSIEQDLRYALLRGELEVYYQPLIDLAAGRIMGYEALLRWNHPTRGVVSPLEFISAAEDCGLIVPIGEWVLEKAIRTAALWPSNLKVAVNVSAVQLRTGVFANTVRDCLAMSGMAPKCLELEITESVLLQNCNMTLTALRELHDLGVRIALDDFGTGFSSLSCLRDFPFDRVKVDRSFIQGLPEEKHASLLVKAIVAMASGFGVAVTAEGVETLDQLRYLHSIGCTEAQGFLFGRPAQAIRLNHRYMICQES
ncbi:putative bifunctional diguanylate cyclase/phosphodiesterase [Acidicapsa acidisoli]|uniref:putative bifunctional diguanylate cyclase/phosphodiesterase n=1 Tax=Acidicapsa acidisoli TaxID=1615681 RepID=UPI0021E0E827|nr:EAL domain-containing protein [Acidicapsa acidisoli]